MNSGKMILDDDFEDSPPGQIGQTGASYRHVLGFPLKANLQTLGVFFVGSSTYAFSIILIAFLTGISVGSLLMSIFIIRFLPLVYLMAVKIGFYVYRKK